MVALTINLTYVLLLVLELTSSSIFLFNSFQHEEFQDKQMQLVTSLETEKRICMERVRRAEKKVERFEKEAQSKPSIREIYFI